MGTITKALRGLSNPNCKRTRELAAHVAMGPKRGWWRSANDAVAAFPARKLKALKASPNWDAIFAAIQQLIEAISAAKQ